MISVYKHVDSEEISGSGHKKESQRGIRKPLR